MTTDAWEEALFGPVPPPQPPGPASYHRFKRITTGHNVAVSMQRQRSELIAALPRMPRRTEHVPLVIDRTGPYYAACAAWSCAFLGPSREDRASAEADALAHSVDRGLGGWSEVG